jgi:hypothetical protein
LSERALVDSEKVAVEMKLQGVGDKEQGTRSKWQGASGEADGKWQMAEERLTRRREGTKVEKIARHLVAKPHAKARRDEGAVRK